VVLVVPLWVMKRNSDARSLKSAILYQGLTIVLLAAACLLTQLTQNLGSAAGFIFFYVAVAASTWYGGAWVGVTAVILATLSVEYFFMPPLHSLRVNREFLPVFVEFAGSAGVIGWFSSWRKQAEKALTEARDELQLRVEERTAELKRTNEQLIAEMAERQQAEEAYYDAQTELARLTRISSMGALAASISHEVNQPLAAVVTNADACAMWLSVEPPNLDEARAAVDAIAREGARASDVVRRIRAMFTKSAPEQSPIDINELIREVSALMEGEASRNQVNLRTELMVLPRATGDRVQLRQVIVNLVLNGIEATSGISDRPRDLIIRAGKGAPDEILIAVQDTGVGIDPKNRRRIFDPYFTTKGQGMGMGLAICHSIIEAHGGRLWATANDSYGTTMQFTLPANSGCE
jgi:C4-dicarboxylate-specific signal transduction histidine kinase